MCQRRPIPAVIRDEFGTVPSKTPVAVLAQSGDDRFIGADKMILKRVPAIPQGLFNHVDKIGADGRRLLDYVTWLRERVEQFGNDDYLPTFHLDVYGTVGLIFEHNTDRIVDYLAKVAAAAAPYSVRIEAPVDLGSRDATLEAMASLRDALDVASTGVQIVADDWCNTLEDIEAFAKAQAAHMIQIKTPDLGCLCNSIHAVSVCHANGIEAFLGGTCNGTDQSSRITAAVALATQADLIYNKPGMGVDEGLMIVTNEMARTLAHMESYEARGTDLT
jgi:methylaspartate ammonia-lyase